MSTLDLYKHVKGEVYAASKIAQPIPGTGIVNIVAPDGVTPIGYKSIKLYDDAVGTTELVLDTDFTIQEKDIEYSAKEGYDVYRSVQIINASYQSAVFYADFDAVGGYVQYNAYPVGSFYTQYPDADSSVLATAFPDAYRPADMFGGTWVAQWDDEGIDFHTERTSDTGLQTRTDGKQADQFQGWQAGGTDVSEKYGKIASNGNASQATPVADNSTPYFDTLSQGVAGGIIAKDDGTNGTPRTGTVTCDSNRLVRIWKRTS